MLIKEIKVKVIGVKSCDNKKTYPYTTYQTVWDGDLEEWIDIAGETVDALDKYDEVKITFTRKE